MMLFFQLIPTRQNFKHVQIESICRRQDKYGVKTEIPFGMVSKRCGKRRKCWLPAFSPFPTTFSKGFLVRVVKSRVCVVKKNYSAQDKLHYMYL